MEYFMLEWFYGRLAIRAGMVRFEKSTRLDVFALQQSCKSAYEHMLSENVDIEQNVITKFCFLNYSSFSF